MLISHYDKIFEVRAIFGDTGGIPSFFRRGNGNLPLPLQFFPPFSWEGFQKLVATLRQGLRKIWTLPAPHHAEVVAAGGTG